ncbi:P pilus assembly protein, chaperone PapD [Coleofasciculus sp. E1-EBD-02]|uniref:P pilus assembly protein, chaperone PapD n=1 Tax=Coleofasciculus sp. E1-EBD-02 TaxID=3068481 RepID=UPI0032F9F6F7
MVLFSKKIKPPLQAAWKAFQYGSWVLSATLLFGGSAQAQLGAAPLVVEVEANRGQAQTMINVINTTDTPLRARIYTEPFTYERDSGFQTLSSSPNYLGSYLQFSPQELTVPPGVSRRVRMRALLAPSLPDGEYRAVVFTETLNEDWNGSGKKLGITARVGTTVYVRKGDISPNLTVNSASFNLKENQLQLLVQNTGDASVRSSVNWELKQGETVIKSGELPASTIIAQSDRNLILNNFQAGTSSLSPGNYQLIGELTWGEDNSNKVPFSVNLTIPEN